MNILNKISIKNLGMNKKRSIGTVIGIILSVALITAVAGMFTSFQKSLVNNTIEGSGYYHMEMGIIDDEILNTLKMNRKIDRIMTTYELGTGKIQSSEEKYPYITVRSTDYFDELAFKIVEGHKPENSRELVINERTAMNANLKVGDTLELELGTRMSGDGYEMSPSNPYLEENGEYIKNPIKKTYKIVGIFSRAGYGYVQAGITADTTSPKLNAFITLSNPKEIDEFESDIKQIEKALIENKDIEYRYSKSKNYELLRWEIFAFSDSTISMLYAVVTVVIIIILATSIFCIRNSFAISATEKSKMLGMLASVGATKRQIKKSVLTEAFILGLIGVPLGILSGIFADFILIKVVNFILRDVIIDRLGIMILNIPWLPILLGAVLGFVTIYLSAIASAIKASRISPIENLRSSKDIKLNSKKLHTPRFIENIFKTGGVLAYKNLKRSKKKYRTTVISLTISVFVFVAMNSFLTETFKVSSSYYKDYDYNMVVSNIASLKQSEIDAIRSLNDIKDIHVAYSTSRRVGYITINDLSKVAITDPDEGGIACTKYDEKTGECTGVKFASLDIYALDDVSFKKYVKKLELDYEQVKTEGILSDYYDLYRENGTTKEVRRYTYKKGDTIEGIYNESPISIRVAATTDTHIFGLEAYNYAGGFLFVDKDYFENIEFEPYLITIDTDNYTTLEKSITEINSVVETSDLTSQIRYEKAIKTIVSIFLYGFITVITLIGVTNIFNTITSNMELRQKEFAMLKSIGMTKREFNRMINLETLFYSMKSLIYGIILGLIGAYAIHNAFGLKEETAFIFPWTSILISIVFVFLLVKIIMNFSMKKINRQNIIETIRKENI